VQGDRRLRDPELRRGPLDRAEPYHGGEGAQLGGCHGWNLLQAIRLGECARARPWAYDHPAKYETF